MKFGPLEYIAIGFDEPKFTGKIMPELNALREMGVIRLLDMVFVRKNTMGDVKILEANDLEEEDAALFRPFLDDLLSMFTEEDVLAIGRTLENDTAAAVVLFEHIWAAKLKKAVKESGGFLIAQDRVSPQVLAELAELPDEELKQ